MEMNRNLSVCPEYKITPNCGGGKKKSHSMDDKVMTARFSWWILIDVSKLKPSQTQNKT